MSFLLSKRSLNNTLIGTRIQLLTSQQSPKAEKNCSPTLKELREQKNKRVKRFSDIFENQSWESKQNGVNWWLSDMLTSPSPHSVKSSTPKQSSVFLFPTPPRVYRARLVFTRSEEDTKLEKLLEMEEEHGRDLNEIVGHLNTSFTMTICFKQKKIREISQKIFEDVKMMELLHEEIHGQLLSIKNGNGDCVDFIEYLGDLIEDGRFHCYINHTFMEKTIKKFHNVDPLSFIPRTNPFKMVEIYHEWTTNVCNELIKNPTENSDEIRSCIETEKKLKNLMEELEGAGEVVRIKEVANIPLDKLVKLYELSKQGHRTLSSLFLLPEQHFKYGIRPPLDIMRLGKFVKNFQIPMSSREYNYKYDGKYFVFERCVIFANLLHGGESFCYESHFWVKDLVFVQTNGKECVRLANKTHNISVDNVEFVKILKHLKKSHDYDGFINAEIRMSEKELHDLTKTSTSTSVNYRRHSFYACNTASFQERMTKFKRSSDC